jgi:ferric-dicitrate binding protein FerR (iron transport regulator)
MNPASDAYAYALALRQERQAWTALLKLQRTDPGYAEALSRWQAAADSMQAALQLPVKTSPPATSQSPNTPAKTSPRG